MSLACYFYATNPTTHGLVSGGMPPATLGISGSLPRLAVVGKGAQAAAADVGSVAIVLGAASVTRPVMNRSRGRAFYRARNAGSRSGETALSSGASWRRPDEADELAGPRARAQSAPSPISPAATDARQTDWAGNRLGDRGEIRSPS
jgi:hypothetical protein